VRHLNGINFVAGNYVASELTVLHTRRTVPNSSNRSSPTPTGADGLTDQKQTLIRLMTPFKRLAMTLPLGPLKTCTNLNSLRSTLLGLCAPFGTVAELDIFLTTQAGQHQALCFWHMQSQEEDARLMRAWGVGRFGGELVAVVAMDADKRASPT